LAQVKAIAERQRLALLKEEEDKKRVDAETKRKLDQDRAGRSRRPGALFRDCYNDDPVRNRTCPEMVVVPAGEFVMGSNDGDAEKPAHRVVIQQPFAVGKFEVTFEEWDVCVADGGCNSNPNPDDRGWGRGRRPVINVSWNDAREYVLWLAHRTGKPYRLLTEAEWEYAARAGSRAKYTWGDEAGKNRANCRGCSSQWDDKHTAPVGVFQSNAFGLHDMHGNVWEWVEDCWHVDYTGAPKDGTAWLAACTDNLRVLRGGSWADGAHSARSSNRGRNSAERRGVPTGFRVARTLD